MCVFLAHALPWARNLKCFIIILLLCGTVVECPDGTNVAKISLHNPNNRIDLLEDMILLQTGDEKYRVDPITFDKILLSSKTAPRVASLKRFSQKNHNLSTAFYQFCGGKCQYQCLDLHNDSQLCFFNAILPGCPTKDYLDTEDRQDCIEHVPMAFLNHKNDHSKNLALQLDCHSTRWEKTKPYIKLTCFMKHYNNNSIDGELHILFETLIKDGHTTYGICRYTIAEIIGAFNNTNVMIGVKDKDNNTWKDVPKNEFTWTRSYIEGFIFDYLPKRTVYDEEYRNHEAITHCVKVTLPGLDHNITSLYCSISNNKIIQIVPETNETIDLYDDIEGKTIQLEIWKEEILLIITKRNLYKRPLYNCTATSCSGCIRKGPYCFWSEKQNSCDGSIDFEQIENLRQKGDIKRDCSSEFDRKISNDPDFKEWRDRVDSDLENLKKHWNLTKINEVDPSFRPASPSVENISRPNKEENISQTTTSENSKKLVFDDSLILIFTIIIIILVLVILLFVLNCCMNYWCKNWWQDIKARFLFSWFNRNPPDGRRDFNDYVMNQNRPLMANLEENQNESRAEVNASPRNGQDTNMAHTSNPLEENENNNSCNIESSENVYDEIN